MHSTNVVLCCQIFFCVILVIVPISSSFGYNRYKLPNQHSKHEILAQKIKIKIFYESLCPGSIQLFVSELQPVVEQFPSYLDLHFVPYGFAKTRTSNGRYSFQCQHGPEECQGNRVHSCVVDELRNNTKAALLNSCLMKFTKFVRTEGYATIMNWCSYKLNIRTHRIWSCVHSDRSSILLKIHGEETRAVSPPYVPYVLLYDAEDTPREVTGDLMTDICIKLDFEPVACRQYLRNINYRIK